MQIAGLVNDALLLVRTREVASRIEIVQMLDPDLHEIEADAEMLKQVLLNLLLNAVQSMSRPTMAGSTSKASQGAAP